MDICINMTRLWKKIRFSKQSSTNTVLTFSRKSFFFADTMYRMKDSLLTTSFYVEKKRLRNGLSKIFLRMINVSRKKEIHSNVIECFVVTQSIKYSTGRRLTSPSSVYVIDKTSSVIYSSHRQKESSVPVRNASEDEGTV